MVSMNIGNKQNLKSRKNFIMESSAEEFCEGAECLAPVLSEAYSYEYEDTPNYFKLKMILLE